MTRDDTAVRRGGMMRVQRSRGMLSGLLLMLLGAWGALIPFIGPSFHYAYTPDSAWAWTSGRLWMSVLPGVAAFVGGLLLATTANRAVGVFAGWLASAAGAWYICGPVLARMWNGPEGSVGSPVGGTTRGVWEQIGFFTGLGTVILFLAAQALGRFTVRSVNDGHLVEQRTTRTAEPVAPVTRTTTPVTTTRQTEFTGNRAVQPEETTTGRTDTVVQPVVHSSGEGATRVDR
jgi:hypothetical protein